MTDLPVFGHWLKQRRKALDLTQEAFAERVGCAVTTIRKIEAGVLRPSQQLAVLLADNVELEGAERARFLAAARARLPDKPARVTAVRTPPGAQAPPAAWPTTLPLPPTPLIGRTQDVAGVCALLQRADVRLLTLTGAGGVGKTRVALEVAAAVCARFTDGVAFVALAPISDADLVVPNMAQALNVASASRRPLLERLQHHLRTKQLLLVLDNFEHVVAAAPAIVDLLAAAPGLKVLVTSRAVLHLSGEQEYPVPPLAPSDAIALFTARAQAATPAFALSATNAEAVAAICRRLDGLPLAIELAAPRLKLFAPEALQTWLEHRLTVLTGGARDLPARQHTMRNTIDWSYQLLDEGEQTLFRRLGVFAGGWTLDAAAAVCNARNDLPSGIVDGMGALVDKSLLRREAGVGHEPRFVMLETLREYALEQLALCGEAATAQQLHAAYYAEALARANARLYTSEQRAATQQLDREHANALAALEWCSATGRFETGLRLCGTLGNYWTAFGQIGLGLRWVDRLLAEAGESVPPDARVAAMNAGGFMNFSHCDYPQARTRYEQSHLLAQRAEDLAGGAVALNGLGMALLRLGDVAAARGFLEQAVALCLQTGNRFELGKAYAALGRVHQFSGQTTDARTCYERALPIAREVGHVTFLGIVLMTIASLAAQTGDYALARAHYAESLAAHRERRIIRRVAETLVSMAEFHTQQGELEAALACYAEAEQHYGAINNQADLGSMQVGRGDIAFQQGAYETARGYYQRALDLFRAAGDQQLIGRTLGALGHTAVRAGQLDEAAGVCAEALTLRRAIGNRPGLIVSLEGGYIELALALGRPALAAQLLGAAEAARAELGLPRPPIEVRAAELVETTLREQLGAAACVSAVAEGRSMSLEQAAAYALDSVSAGSMPARLEPEPFRGAPR